MADWDCVRITWGIEMTYCTPYLLQLGLTKSRTSLVWIAGPLSGLIMQPIVGVIADRSRSKWGRRRPFMIGGSIIVAACLLVLGWTADIVGLFTSKPDTARSCTIALAVLSIYAVDFAINAVQSSSRSLIVDTLPISKQQLGSAWVGYAAGTVDLLKIFGTTLGDSQFKQLTVIAAAALLAAVGITSYAVEERVLISTRDSDAKSGAVRMVAHILKTTLHLPNRIQAICWIQFWSWIGWFPFLFYSATWVGETYFRYDATKTAQESSDALGDIGRIGSLSLVVFSVVTLVSSVLLPWIVKSPEDEKPGFTPRPPPSIAPLVNTINKYKPDLLTAWTFSHFVFAGAMMLAPFVRSVRFATILVSICGIPWALACWAPFAFIGIEINRLTAPTTILANGSSYRRLSTDSADSAPPSPSLLRLHHLDIDDPSAPAPSSATGETAGIYLGILNLFTTLPQFVGTFISMVVFSVLEPGKSPELAGEGAPTGEAEAEVPKGPNAIAVCLFIGAVSAVGAAYATRRLKFVR
ncbi:Major facilitator superfamily domain, general substrate transporter [Lasallia pustulata]|uniref:Major facilitator superfamily domain, general substrate transporter n=1 Tax=Lasallia pustulata TaxID=136370 RepID=A0A1W5DAA7_9LECA|nr:Major facilitator superfamily domain, general substrate transporter [Lasallia pustulata]